MAEKIIIIGGGAAGLMAGIAAARAGVCPLILEGGERVGKKILATGNGKCNYTNLEMGESYFNCDRPGFVGQVLQHFNTEDTLDFFESIGILPRIRNGYVYPRSEQASSVLDALRMEADRLGAKILTGKKVDQIRYTGRFTVYSGTESWQADKVILAAGGCAAPKTGSDGSGHGLAKSLGHSLVPIIPALVQLRVKENFMKSVAGVRTQARVHIFVKNRLTAEDEGEVQLTDYGISGIPVFQVSRHAARALDAGLPVRAVLDFLPEMEAEEIADRLKRWKRLRPQASMEELLVGILPKKLGELILRVCREKIFLSGDSSKKSAARKPEPGIWDVVETCKNFELHVTATNGFEQAQVSAGGVNTREIDPASCQSTILPGLYLAGEILDVDGICGGYNLQWAWSTGMIAGSHAAKSLGGSSKKQGKNTKNNRDRH